jgi:hypothetical protein
MKFVLVMMIYAGWDENALAINKVEGFTSAKACQQAGQVFQSMKNGTAYRSEFVCLEVK